MGIFTTYDFEPNPETQIAYELPEINIPNIVFNKPFTLEPVTSIIQQKVTPVSNSLDNAISKYSGKKYQFGGTGNNGIDCSSFTQKTYAELGIKLPRTAEQQYKDTIRINNNEAKKGDLVFLKNTYKPGISHVGILQGKDENGNLIVAESSSSKGSGGNHIWNLSKGYYNKHFAGFGRINKMQFGGTIYNSTMDIYIPKKEYEIPTMDVPFIEYPEESYIQSVAENPIVRINNPPPTTKPTASINQVIQKIINKKYATDPNYGSKLLTMISSVKNAKGANKQFVDKRLSSYLSKGLDHNTALVYTAQDALESGWGKTVKGKHNYGNIKGKGKKTNTKEFINGKWINMNSSFKDFNSDDEYTDFKINLLS